MELFRTDLEPLFPMNTIETTPFDPSLVDDFFDNIDLERYPQLRELVEYYREHFRAGGNDAN